MARIVDKDTRLIDVDFGPVSIFGARLPGEQFPDGNPGNIFNFSGPGMDQVIRQDADGIEAGSFIQYQRVDLSYMAENGEIMQPVEASVQRTGPVPFGSHENGNNHDAIMEYIFILSRPLNNNELAIALAPWSDLSQLGLDYGTSQFGGASGGGVTQEQNIYSEKRTYVFNSNQGATQSNLDLVPGNTDLNSQFGEPTLIDVTTWGSMSAITGPNLHCYRVVYSRLQGFIAPGTLYTNVNFGGLTTLAYPPVNVTFLCKDPSYTEGEYITRLANAMNSLQQGDATFD